MGLLNCFRCFGDDGELLGAADGQRLAAARRSELFCKVTDATDAVLGAVLCSVHKWTSAVVLPAALHFGALKQCIPVQVVTCVRLNGTALLNRYVDSSTACLTSMIPLAALLQCVVALPSRRQASSLLMLQQHYNNSTSMDILNVQCS
jgi:hypothetical protein